MNEQLRKFVSSRKSLFWFVKEPENLSLEAVVETILNFGDWQDFQQLLELAGKERVAEIFQKQISGKRNNYRTKIANYFSLYFQKHAR